MLARLSCQVRGVSGVCDHRRGVFSTAAPGSGSHARSTWFCTQEGPRLWPPSGDPSPGWPLRVLACNQATATWPCGTLAAWESGRGFHARLEENRGRRDEWPVWGACVLHPCRPRFGRLVCLFQQRRAAPRRPCPLRGERPFSSALLQTQPPSRARPLLP